jgi:ACS family sodium-dependent inorganic phosphate cotransporter
MSQSRRLLVFLAVAAAYICLIDRVAISVAIIPMVETFGWRPSEQGAIMSAFFVGYVLLQLPAGWLSDRYGGKWVLGFGVVLWSLFTALTPPAAAASLTVLIICRFLMGMAESVTWPAVYSLFAQWLPVSERGLALGLLNSSVSGGTIIALAATPFLIEFGGWQAVFYVYGGLGLLWALVWLPSIPNKPNTGAVSGGEVDTALASVEDLKPFTPRNVLRSRPVWVLAYAHFATNWVVFLSLAWLPTYFSRAFGLDIRAVGLLAVLPYLVSVLATPFFGRLADQALRKGMDRTRLRRRMQVLALGGVGAITLVVGYAETIEVAIALFCVANFCVAASVGGFAANHMDIAPNHSGTLYGATNAMASFASAGSVFVAGLMLEWTGSWVAVFQSAAIIALSGAVVYGWGASAQREF